MLNFLDSLKALADQNRYQIIKLLFAHDFCVGALARRIGISEAAVSQHLKILRESGVVVGEKRGYWTHYKVKQDALLQVAAAIQGLTTNCPTDASGYVGGSAPRNNTVSEPTC